MIKVPDHVTLFAVSRYPLNLSGIHGQTHWERVHKWGMALSLGSKRADPNVVAHFAVLHDMCRRHDGTDPEHGPRASALLEENIDVLTHLTTGQRRKLLTAISGHSDGTTSKDDTIGCCWDADRLDLPRVGLTPEPKYMSTESGLYTLRELYGPHLSVVPVKQSKKL